MACKKMSPVPRAGGDRGSEMSVLATGQTEFTTSPLHLQTSYLSRRFRVAPAVASLIAEIAFECGRRA